MTPEPHVRPAPVAGRMTVVMRAAVPREETALRIAVVRQGRVVEERLFRTPQRISVGSSERATLTLPAADCSGEIVVFEAVGQSFVLRADISGQIGEDGKRGRIRFGESTLLFQVVLLPPDPPRAKLPIGILRGEPIVDWTTTLIAALAFLLHFLAIGALYSDWVDPVVNDGVVVAAVVDAIRAPPAPAIETAELESAASNEPTSSSESTPGPASDATRGAMRTSGAAGLASELEAISMGVLGALGSEAPATSGVLGDGELPTSDLDEAARRESGVSGPGQIALAPGAHTLRPGERPGSLRDLGNRNRERVSDRGSIAKPKGPMAAADVSAPTTIGRVEDAARVVAGMRPGFRQCYQRALDGHPDAEGSVRLSIRVGPNGEVSGVGATASGNMPGSLVACVRARAQNGQFSPPEGGSAVVDVPVIFRKQR